MCKITWKTWHTAWAIGVGSHLKVTSNVGKLAWLTKRCDFPRRNVQYDPRASLPHWYGTSKSNPDMKKTTGLYQFRVKFFAELWLNHLADAFSSKATNKLRFQTAVDQGEAFEKRQNKAGDASSRDREGFKEFIKASKHSKAFCWLKDHTGEDFRVSFRSSTSLTSGLFADRRGTRRLLHLKGAAGSVGRCCDSGHSVGEQQERTSGK